MNATDLHKITDWLIDGARSASSPNQMMAETCERLVAAGLPLWRVGVFVRTLHPDILARNFIWRRGAEVVAGTAEVAVPAAPGLPLKPHARSAPLRPRRSGHRRRPPRPPLTS